MRKETILPMLNGFESTGDRKSTRLNSSHTVISYAVFCLKKKKKNIRTISANDETMRYEQISEIDETKCINIDETDYRISDTDARSTTQRDRTHRTILDIS